LEPTFLHWAVAVVLAVLLLLLLPLRLPLPLLLLLALVLDSARAANLAAGGVPVAMHARRHATISMARLPHYAMHCRARNLSPCPVLVRARRNGCAAATFATWRRLATYLLLLRLRPKHHHLPLPPPSLLLLSLLLHPCSAATTCAPP
jgi:hypothetical protein